MIYVFIFVFGAIIGSFLNVVILRYNTGESLFRRGSRCFVCAKRLKWYELIPIFSFLIQKGRCRECGSRISIQYPVIEIMTGLLFLVVTWKLGFQVEAELLFGWLIVSLLIIIAVYDFRHKIIPNAFVYSFIILAFLNLFRISEIWPNFLAGVAFFSFFALLWAVSKGKWMGFGDAKLALGLGWLLGAEKTIWAFLFSFWLGGIVSIFLLILNRKTTMKSKIPFGPFLIVGALLALFLNIDILQIFNF